ncbi:24512_t:CDS:2, partial [Entrophospora sp. SA101]
MTDQIKLTIYSYSYLIGNFTLQFHKKVFVHDIFILLLITYPCLYLFKRTPKESQVELLQE